MKEFKHWRSLLVASNIHGDTRRFLNRIVDRGVLLYPNCHFLRIEVISQGDSVGKGLARLMKLQRWPGVGSIWCGNQSEAVVLAMVIPSYFGGKYVSMKAWNALWSNSIRGAGEIVVKRIAKNELGEALKQLKIESGRMHVSGIFRKVPRTPLLEDFCLGLDL